MFTPNLPAARTRSWVCARFAIETTQSGGVSDPDMNALAVMPRGSPPSSMVMTVTPVAKPPIVLRNNWGSNAGALIARPGINDDLA